MTLVGYIVTAVLAGIAGFAIGVYKHRQERDVAYQEGFEDSRTSVTAIREEETTEFTTPLPISIDHQDLVDQYCDATDEECAIFMAQKAAEMTATRADIRAMFAHHEAEDAMTGPMPIIAREVQVTAREVIYQ